MRALVAGGAGFVGSHLVDRLLAEGHEVDVVDDLSTGSLANLAEARSARTGRLKIHQGRRPPRRCDDVGRAAVPRGRLRARPWGRRRRRRLGRAAVARRGADPRRGSTRRIRQGGRRRERRAVRPNHRRRRCRCGESEIAARDGASAAQVALLAYLSAYREAHGLEFTVLALGSVYGPRQRHGVVAELVRRAWAGESTTLHGGGRQTRDLVFVDDVVDALVRAAERGSGLVVNVATGVETSIVDLHRLVVDAVVAAGGPASAARAGARSAPVRGPSRLALDPGRARIHLGWTPWTSLGEGIAHTVDAAHP